MSTTLLFSHTPPASAPWGPSSAVGNTVACAEQDGERQILVGFAWYTIDQARDLIATIQAAIEVGEASMAAPG